MTESTLVKEKVCPKCNTSFDCQSGNCWCGSLPPILPIEGNQGCLCKSCLTQEIKVKIETYIENITPQRQKEIKQLGSPQELVEEIDYYINKEGLYVFTAWYHLRRGYCCGNGSLHCPYKK